MKRSLRFLFAAFLAPTLSLPLAAEAGKTNTAASLLPKAPDGFEWKPQAALSDEFDGNKLDTTKWQPKHPYWSGRTPSRFDSANVSVADGLLHLRSTTKIKDLSEVKDPKHDNWVDASCVTSKKASATPGYYECRFKASQLSMTSSFWFQGGNGEIDVVEQIGAPVEHPEKTHQMLMNTHHFSRKNGKKIDEATPFKWTMPSGSAEKFHTYGVWWKDQHHAWFYHEGKKVAELRFAAPFTRPMYLFMDTEVFTWEGLPSIESLNDPEKNAMLVDWVRSWKLVPVAR